MAPSGVVVSTTPGRYEVGESSVEVTEAEVAEHWGAWQCRACNILGCDTATIHVWVTGTLLIHTSGQLLVGGHGHFSIFMREFINMAFSDNLAPEK